MEVAVVIPLYNGARWIEDTLRSVKAQTHSPREIVVVDDGSDDGSKDVVRSSFPEVELLENPNEGEGAGPVRRYGLKHTTAPLVAFLDQDDLWHPDHLRILTHLLGDSDHPAAIAGLDHFRDSSTPTFNVQPDEVHLFSPWERFPLNSIHSPSCVLIQREALDEIGGWPSEFTISDMHAWFKLTVDAPMIRTEKVSVGKRVHNDSYLERLRSKDASSFLQRHVRVCEDALSYRKDLAPASSEEFENRMETFKVLRRALEGVIRNDLQLLKKAAHYLEQENQTGQNLTREYWFFLLRVFSMPKSQIPTKEPTRERQLLARIVQAWPNRGPWARASLSRALVQTISYKAFLIYFALAPIQAVSSLLFLECMTMQVKRAVHRFKESVRASVGSTCRYLVEQLRLGVALVNRLRPRS